ncbi:hypothetical protein, partial [Paractinoplanes toevensis]|uniref:hypothetical protein n=1 Tax=Paractinoplanes toevensis TaxID=571911 RepID=UPI001FE77314
MTTSRSRWTVSGTIRFTGGFANVTVRILGVGACTLIVLGWVISVPLRCRVGEGFPAVVRRGGGLPIRPV